MVTDGLYDLSGMHLYKETMKGDAFVLFTRDGCDVCKKVEGTWKEIAKIYENTENVKIGQVIHFFPPKKLVYSVTLIGPYL